MALSLLAPQPYLAPMPRMRGRETWLTLTHRAGFCMNLSPLAGLQQDCREVNQCGFDPHGHTTFSIEHNRMSNIVTTCRGVGATHFSKALALSDPVSLGPSSDACSRLLARCYFVFLVIVSISPHPPFSSFPSHQRACDPALLQSQPKYLSVQLRALGDL